MTSLRDMSNEQVSGPDPDSDPGEATGQETATVLSPEQSSRKNSQVPSATGIRRAAMDWLARREYSRREIEQKLRRRFPDATAAIGPVLDQLEHEGLLSTTRYLDSVSRSHIRRGYGPQRIRAVLRNKGVGAEGMDAVTAANDTVDWLTQAREVRSRKFGETLPSGPAERNRQMAFLLRRGFSSDICRKACLPPREE